MEVSAAVRDEADLSDAYGRLRGGVLRRARRWFPTLSEPDLEDVYQAAWLSIVRTQSEVSDVEGYLFEAVRSQGLMELRRRRRKPAESLEASGTLGGGGEEAVTPAALVDPARTPEECVEVAELSRWTEEILAELSSRQRAIAKLRWGWGFSREEIAGVLGMSPRAVRRELGRLSVRLREQAEVVASGGWCEQRRSLVTAYAVGLLSPRRERRAEDHLHACPGCRALVRELRGRADGLAAALPAPVLADSSDGQQLGRLGEMVEATRSHLQDGLTSAKQQAVSAYARAGDPTPLAGARPGSVAAAVAGCLAVGGGAYCAVEGLPDPVRAALEIGQREEGPEHPDQSHRPVAEAPQPPPSSVSEPPAIDTPAPTSEAPPPPPAPEPEEFFGAGSSPPPAPAAGSSSPSAGLAAGAPVPAQARGEFGGP